MKRSFFPAGFLSRTRTVSGRSASLRFGVFSLALVLASFNIGAADLPDLGDVAQNELSPQMERRIGDNLMNEIRLREPTYVDDNEVNDYLLGLGNRLVASCPDPSGHFRFFAVNDKSINAFAMFGGYIGVNTGLILATQSESELAGVLSHEISHVTQHHLARQIAKAKQDSLLSLAAVAAAILAARSGSSSGSNAGQAVITSAAAASAQSQLAFSRDFEREADRIGFETLQKARFDPRGMALFFQRLQRNARLYENNATVYLSTHPLNTERIADMSNREENLPYRQVQDSTDYLLIRARLRAQEGTGQEAMSEFTRQLREQKAPNEAAARYGLAVAALRARDYKTAATEIETLGRLKVSSPVIDSLAAQAKSASGDKEGALTLYRAALQRYPNRKSLMIGYTQTLLAAKRPAEAERFMKQAVENNQDDDRFYGLLAQSYDAQGKQLLQHLAQAEVYVLRGLVDPAIEQLELAQKAKDGNFFDQSVVDARLRALRQRKIDEAKNPLKL